jgi:hypothetical protein
LPFNAATNKEVKDIWRQASERMKKGDFDGAAAQYRRLAQLRPGWGPAVEALTKLAAQSASAGIAAQNRARTGELAGVVAHYSLEASLHPEVASNHYKLGAALGKIGDLDGDENEPFAWTILSRDGFDLTYSRGVRSVLESALNIESLCSGVDL